MSTQDIQKSSYVSNKIRYVGKYTLLKHIMKQPNADKLATEIFSTHLYLLKALEILNKHSIVHFDLKYNNIMFDDKIKHPIIIDFGLSMHIPSIRESTIDDRFYVFEAYSYWCFEIHILNYICQIIQIQRAKTIEFTKDDISMLINTFIYGSDYIEGGVNKIKNDIFNNSISLPKDIETYTNSLALFMNKYIGKNWFYIYESMIKTHDTWDGYSLAVIYLFILDDLHMKEGDLYSNMINKYKTNFEKYRNFLTNIIYAMPGERMSLAEMKSELTKLAK
jgi:serine/threonine protein kinase